MWHDGVLAYQVAFHGDRFFATLLLPVATCLFFVLECSRRNRYYCEHDL